jgi:uncharacterized membrane protein YdcZ (DUF606 family)
MIGLPLVLFAVVSSAFLPLQAADQFGLVGFERHAITPLRALGVALLVGVALLGRLF